MSETCTIVIGAPELLDSLRRHITAPGEILCFADSDALKALEVISVRRPDAIALERLFAATSRGAALIHRLKADPALAGVEIRIMSHDGTHGRVSPRRTPAAPVPAAAGHGHADIPPQHPEPAAHQGLDFTGTRRVPRFRIRDGVEVQIDGGLARLVDLSTMGAQVVSAAALRPAQQIKVILADDLGVVRLNASVAWASIELPKGGGLRYRAGVEFKQPETKSVDAFCRRHQV